MSLRILDRVVVFDYGEVISRSPGDNDRADLLAAAGAEPDRFWPSYWRHRDQLDRGTLSVTDYWLTIAGDIGATWSASDLQRLWAADFRGWISVEPGTVELLAELSTGGTRLALLSNAGFDFSDPLRFSPMGRYFERVFISAEMDALKPDPEIYLEVAGELGITPQQMVFIDNKSANTDAAAALGVTVHHFTGVEGLSKFLQSLSSTT
ncbi:MAG TPA: HAD family phosphatase [Galbitalea sp.]|nr:HAD family phosphatase [Galbitalea sp.]